MQRGHADLALHASRDGHLGEHHNGYRHGRCVDELEVWLEDGKAYSQLPPAVLGAVITTQASSIRDLELFMRAPDLTGDDVAIIVSPFPLSFHAKCNAGLLTNVH